MINFLHLFPRQLGLNGEAGNLSTLVSRLRWSGISSSITTVEPGQPLPATADAVLIGSGTLSGLRAALVDFDRVSGELRNLKEQGVPFFAVGNGWEMLGESIRFVGGEEVKGAGVFPSRSFHGKVQVSQECFGHDEFGNLTTGYANHFGDLELLEGSEPLIRLSKGYGNSSSTPAPEISGEGLIAGSLMATRLNGPVLPMNPHLADRFLNFVGGRMGLLYDPVNEASVRADGFASKVREELRDRLTR